MEYELEVLERKVELLREEVCVCVCMCGPHVRLWAGAWEWMQGCCMMILCNMECGLEVLQRKMELLHEEGYIRGYRCARGNASGCAAGAIACLLLCAHLHGTRSIPMHTATAPPLQLVKAEVEKEQLEADIRKEVTDEAQALMREQLAQHKATAEQHAAAAEQHKAAGEQQAAEVERLQMLVGWFVAAGVGEGGLQWRLRIGCMCTH